MHEITEADRPEGSCPFWQRWRGHGADRKGGNGGVPTILEDLKENRQAWVTGWLGGMAWEAWSPMPRNLAGKPRRGTPRLPHNGQPG